MCRAFECLVEALRKKRNCANLIPRKEILVRIPRVFLHDVDAFAINSLESNWQEHNVLSAFITIKIEKCIKKAFLIYTGGSFYIINTYFDN